MTDDRVVVELLTRLKQAQSTTKPPAVIPLRWGLRLPRSKPSTSGSLRCGRKDRDIPARCNPTTPLSWSGGGGGAASPSVTAEVLKRLVAADVAAVLLLASDLRFAVLLIYNWLL